MCIFAAGDMIVVDGDVIGEPICIDAVANLQAKLTAGTDAETIVAEDIHGGADTQRKPPRLTGWLFRRNRIIPGVHLKYDSHERAKENALQYGYHVYVFTETPIR